MKVNKDRISYYIFKQLYETKRYRFLPLITKLNMIKTSIKLWMKHMVIRHMNGVKCNIAIIGFLL